MLRRIKNERACAIVGLVGLAMLLNVQHARAESAVTVFEQPPSLGEVEQAFGMGGPRLKTRSIVVDDPPPASAGTSRPHVIAHAPGSPPGQFSKNAIAMHINFDFNSSAIRPDSEPFIDSVAQLLQKHPEIELLIEGHTDASGSRTVNLRLSKQRALAVRDELVRKYGVSAAHLVVAGKGPDEPLDPADPNNAENRRVQFRIHS